MDGVLFTPLRLDEDAQGSLLELFRIDDSEVFAPAMGLCLWTKAGKVRGPRMHHVQRNRFVFSAAAGDVWLSLWDAREHSPNRGDWHGTRVGISCPVSVVIPAGVVYGFRNIGETDSLVLNFPDRLYKGCERLDPADVVLFENDPNSPYAL